MLNMPRGWRDGYLATSFGDSKGVSLNSDKRKLHKKGAMNYDDLFEVTNNNLLNFK